MGNSINEFVYRAVRKECIGKSNVWVQRAINEILSDMTKQIESTDKAPLSEDLDRIEAALKALKDELTERETR